MGAKDRGPADVALPSGIYDEVITRALRQTLADPAISARRGALAPGTASDVLARHIFRFAASVLSSVTGSDQERVDKQIELTNRLLSWLAQFDGAVDPGDEVTAERLLQAPRARPPVFIISHINKEARSLGGYVTALRQITLTHICVCGRRVGEGLREGQRADNRRRHPCPPASARVIVQRGFAVRP